MASLNNAVYTIKDKITSTQNLAIHMEGQTRTNNLAIQGLTMDLELLKTDQDLYKDRLDDCFRQIETLRIIQQEQEGKLVEFGSTQDRVLAEFQALKEELQQERERNQESGRQVQVVCSKGWSRQENGQEIVNVGDGTNQYWPTTAPFGLQGVNSVGSPYQGQLVQTMVESKWILGCKAWRPFSQVSQSCEGLGSICRVS